MVHSSPLGHGFAAVWHVLASSCSCRNPQLGSPRVPFFSSGGMGLVEAVVLLLSEGDPDARMCHACM